MLRMTVLVAGADGQLGLELQKHAPDWATVVACDRSLLDLGDPGSVEHTITAYQPDVVINAAAYTDVDGAESEPEAAHAVNAHGAGQLAAAADRHGARLIQISTDFVFDGQLARPYRPDDRPNPRCVYGASKHAGEAAVLETCGDNCVIIRTSWLYAARGQNFVNSMLRLMQTKEELGVVADQVGSPTWAAGLAAAIWDMIARPELSGIHHWSDAGVASWYDFAVAVRDDAHARGLLEHRIPVRPLTTEQFPRPAPRPPSSILETSNAWGETDTPLVHWRQALGCMLDELTEETAVYG